MVYPTSEYPDMEAMLYAFMRESGLSASDIEGAAFGVAGPVLDNVVTLTNANWQIDGTRTADALELPRVRMVNDLTAMAWGVTVLTPDEYVTLQAGRRDPRGNMVVIAPGTGLGESLLHNEGGRLMPSPSEGGHADFAVSSSDAVAITACSRAAAVHTRRAGSPPPLADSSASASHRSSVDALTPTSADTRSTGALSGGSSLATTRSL